MVRGQHGMQSCFAGLVIGSALICSVFRAVFAVRVECLRHLCEMQGTAVGVRFLLFPPSCLMHGLLESPK